METCTSVQRALRIYTGRLDVVIHVGSDRFRQLPIMKYPYNVTYHQKAHIAERRRSQFPEFKLPPPPLYYYFSISIFIIPEVSKEEQMKAAIKAFNEDKYQSESACAYVVDVPSRTLRKRLNESLCHNQARLVTFVVLVCVTRTFRTQCARSLAA